MKKDMKEWIAKAEDAVKKASAFAVSNPDKLEKAVDFFVQAADDKLVFKNPLWEVVSDAALRKVLRPLIMGYIHTTYKRMKADGRI